MAIKLYGSLDNRFEENRMFCEKIEVGTGVTEYSWSDRHPYEVTEVTDQKHIKIRAMDHKHVGDGSMDNHWELTSNTEAPEIELNKRGNYWYAVSTITPDEAKEIMDSNDIDMKLWACHHGFNLPEIIESGKIKKSYDRMNVSFGKAEYYYDYEF